MFVGVVCEEAGEVYLACYDKYVYSDHDIIRALMFHG